MWELNPRGLSTTDLAGLPHTRLGESRTPSNSANHYTVFQLNLSGYKTPRPNKPHGRLNVKNSSATYFKKPSIP
jgi:hypothetical protein